MNAVGVIPARWASTRFPGKSLAQVAGKPLIRRVVEQVCKARRLSEVVVATDDARIGQAVCGMGVRVAMTRADHASGTDRVAEAVEGMDAEVILNVQGDEPLIEPALLDRLVETLSGDAPWDMSTAASPVRNVEELGNPGIVKVVMAEDGRALYFSRFAIPYVRDRAEPAARPCHWRHLGVYAYRMDFLRRFVSCAPCMLERAEKLEQLRALHLGGRVRVVTGDFAGVGVDTPQDVGYVEGFIRARVDAGGERGLETCADPSESAI